MIRLILFASLFFLTASNTLEPANLYPDLGNEFPLLWKTDIGRASYRNNVILTKEHLLIGSNGNGFLDYRLYDKRSGVYFLDRKSGKTVNHFGYEQLGDMDVAGILLINNRCYFGNDNDEFLCTDLHGKVLWRNAASGDIEHEPVMIRSKGGDLIVYASEQGEVKAVDPTTGKKVWNYYAPDFKGYKEGDSRIAFKVRTYFSDYSVLMLKPVLADLNQDGVNDLVYLSRMGKIIALNGQTGAVLWIYSSANMEIDLLAQTGSDREPSLSFTESFYDEATKKSNYSLVSLNRRGQVVEKKEREHIKLGRSIHQSIIAGDTTLYNRSDSIFFIKNGRVERSIPYEVTNVNDNEYHEYYAWNRDALFGNNVFPMEGHQRCIVLLNQNRIFGNKRAVLEIISLDSGEVVRRFSLPADSEMPPQIADINKDGKLDLLINCSDGYLYCYNLQIKAHK